MANLLESNSLNNFNEYEGGLYMQLIIVLYFDFKYILSISTNIEFVSPPIFMSGLTLYCIV